MTRYGELVSNDYFGPSCPAAEWSKGESVKQIEYAPHGRPGSTFKAIEGIFSDDPSERQDAAEARGKIRDELGWPRDAFVTLIVASNSEASNRKAFDAGLMAWSRFATGRDLRDEGSSWLHIHSRLDGAMDMLRVLEVVGEVSDRTRFTNPADTCGKTKITKANQARQVGDRVTASLPDQLHSTSNEDMAKMYQAADVLLACSCAEGFGVPIIEAQLCGCPVVTNKSTAMTELTRMGYAVPPAQWLSRNDFNAGWDAPDAKGLVRALRRLSLWTPEYRARQIRKHYGDVHAEYEPEPVGREWVRIAEDLMSRRQEDGSIAGFPSFRNRQLAAGKTVRDIFKADLDDRVSITPFAQQLALCEARERDAEVFRLV